jgi:hypothetical protein
MEIGTLQVFVFNGHVISVTFGQTPRKDDGPKEL